MAHRKLSLKVIQDAEGYPPVGVERVWMEELSEETGCVDSISFFSRDVALGDIVEFVVDDGERWYKRTIKRFGNALFRAVYYPSADVAALRSSLKGLGCETELDEAHTLVSISVPPNCVTAVQAFLAEAEGSGEVGYEEAILVQ